MNEPDGDLIRRRDEILQVMFWLRGEGLADAAGAAELQPFLDRVDVGSLVDDLAALARSGLLEPVASGRYRLTERGAEEGGRRFADEFAGLTQQGHGACNDPMCECHFEGPEACIHSQ